MVEGRSVIHNLTGKSTGRRPLGRSRRRWDDNIRMDLEETGISTSKWIDSTQNRAYWRVLVNAAMNLRGLQAMELGS